MVNGGSEQASLLAGEPAQMLAQLHLTEQIAQFVVSAAEQIRAHIAEKMKVTGQYWNRKAQVVCQAAGRFGYRPAEVAHDGAGGAELRCGFFQLRQYGVAPFGGDLPGA